ncbi:hypothetical protein ACEV60_27680, partial [Enterobacter ludwigii]|uniref:hypothetical protein n=1 Tax=Enterobacter ludwigii TaxID=299767 RepID=UPI003BEF36D2
YYLDITCKIPGSRQVVFIPGHSGYRLLITSDWYNKIMKERNQQLLHHWYSSPNLPNVSEFLPMTRGALLCEG